MPPSTHFPFFLSFPMRFFDSAGVSTSGPFSPPSGAIKSPPPKSIPPHQISQILSFLADSLPVPPLSFPFFGFSIGRDHDLLIAPDFFHVASFRVRCRRRVV